MKNLRRIALLCMIMASLSLVACGSEESETESQVQQETEVAETETADSETRTVEHAFGTTEIPTAPEKIVSVYLEDMLLALDVPLQLAVTVGEDSYLSDEMESRGIATVATGETINYEVIIEQEPDLIITMDVITQEAYDQLNKIAPTIAFSRRSWQDSIFKLAAALGVEDKAEACVEEHNQLIAEAKDQLSDILAVEPNASVIRSASKTLRVYFPGVMSADLRQGYVTVLYEDLGFGVESYISELQQSDPARENAQISMEVLPELAAEYLFVIVGSAGNTIEAQQQDQADFEETIKSSIWTNLEAVQNDNVYYLDARFWISDGPLADQMKINQVVELLTADAAE